MAKNPTGGSHRLVTLSLDASDDELEIYYATARRWDNIQAHKYIEFLEKTIQELADDPDRVPFEPRLSGYKILRSAVEQYPGRTSHFLPRNGIRH